MKEREKDVINQTSFLFLFLIFFFFFIFYALKLLEGTCAAAVRLANILLHTYSMALKCQVFLMTLSLYGVSHIFFFLSTLWSVITYFPIREVFGIVTGKRKMRSRMRQRLKLLTRVKMVIIEKFDANNRGFPLHLKSHKLCKLFTK